MLPASGSSTTMKRRFKAGSVVKRSARSREVSVGRVMVSPKSSLLLVKDLMDERDRDRAFTHGRGDAFDVAAAHVADREHSGKARFEQMGRPCERPVRGGEVLLR